MDTHITGMRHAATSGTVEQRKADLDRRLTALFWALLFILVGTIWLFPAQQVPPGTWLVGIGLILLFLNGVRFLNAIPVRVLPTCLGVLALAAGLAEYAGLRLPLISLTFIAIGASIIFELLATRKA